MKRKKPRTWTRWAIVGRYDGVEFVEAGFNSRQRAKFNTLTDSSEQVIRVRITEVLPKPRKSK
jgi:hypothetical protein